MVRKGSALCLGLVAVVAFVAIRRPQRFPDGRLLNVRNAACAAFAAVRGVGSVRFVFDSDGPNGLSRYGEFSVDDPRQVAEIVDALEHSSRDPGPTGESMEPGEEKEDADRIELLSKDGENPITFRVIEDDLADKWGPKVKLLYDRYRKAAHVRTVGR